ncbi:MAG: response regulator [Anaerolineales bacterium]
MDKTKKLVLLIEDDPNDILLFEKAVMKCDFEVNIVVLRDGEEAIAYLSGNGKSKGHPAPDLILLDLKLPRKSGFEVLEWIKNHSPLQTIPVIILSSSKQAQDLDIAYKLGANSYLVKPTAFTALYELVKDLGCYWLVHNQSPKFA